MVGQRRGGGGRGIPSESDSGPSTTGSPPPAEPTVDPPPAEPADDPQNPDEKLLASLLRKMEEQHALLISSEAMEELLLKSMSEFRKEARLREISLEDDIKALERQLSDIVLSEEKHQENLAMLLPTLHYLHDPISPSTFAMPSGSSIWRKLTEFVDAGYRSCFFKEVSTPNLYNIGQWDLACCGRMNIQKVSIHGMPSKELGIKLYNCPGHCLIFKKLALWVHELPIRLVECNAMLSYELNGAGYHKGDAHVFCRVNQIRDEVMNIFNFCSALYKALGLTVDFELLKRPGGFYGLKDKWDVAECNIKKALKECCVPWKVVEECGALSGPTVSAKCSDATGTLFRTPIIQLDFNLPEHFDLPYVMESGEGSERPVVIHVDIFGSVEEMTNILSVHYKGRWPFWLSPTQVVVYSTSEVFHPYALQVLKEISKNGYIVDICIKDKKGQEIHESRLEEYNYKLVVGEDEDNAEQLKVHERGSSDVRVKSISEVLEILKQENEKHLKLISERP